MKEKLAPIHFIQHQRIHLQEQLESYLSLTLPQLKQWDSWVIKRQSVSSRRV